MNCEAQMFNRLRVKKGLKEMADVDIPALIAAVRRAIRARQETDPRYSLRRFAADAGVQYTTLVDILNGTTKNPRAATVGKLLAHINSRVLVYRTMYPREEGEAAAQLGAPELPAELIEQYRQDPEKVAELSRIWGKLSPQRQARALAYLRGMEAADDDT